MPTSNADELVFVSIAESRWDRSSKLRVRQQVAAHLRPGVTLVLDLNQVRFLDGQGCGAMLVLQKTLVDMGGDLCVCSLQASVRKLYQRLGLHRRVQTFNRREDVLRSTDCGRFSRHT